MHSFGAGALEPTSSSAGVVGRPPAARTDCNVLSAGRLAACNTLACLHCRSVWLLLLVFSIYTVRSQVKLLLVVLTQHVRAGAEYLVAEYLFCIGLPHSQVKLLFAVLAQHVRAGAEYLAAEY